MYLLFINDQFCDNQSKGALVTLAGALTIVRVFYLLLTTYVPIWKVEAPLFAEDNKPDIPVQVGDKEFDSNDLHDQSIDLPSSIYRNPTYRDMFFALRLSSVMSANSCWKHSLLLAVIIL